MHFVVIAAFALVLSARTPMRSWWWFTSPETTYWVVAGQMAGVALLALLSTWWVMRRLRRRPHDVDPAQRSFGRHSAVLRMLVLGLLGFDVLATPWTEVVRKTWGLGDWVAIDDLVAMMPFFVGVVLYWAIQYPADKAIRLAAAGRPGMDEPAPRIWRLGEYLLFNIRHQLLLIVVPMAGILVAYDLAAKYSGQLYRWTRLEYAEQAALMIAAGFMFLISPVVLRYVWSTRVLPHGRLRQNLQRICDHIRMKYQQILIWQSDGVVVNAAVMGLVPTFRYVLLSDGLLDTMREDQIEAVFGHEAGHVKHYHIHFYLLFAALSMLLVGGMLLLMWEYLPYKTYINLVNSTSLTKWMAVSRADWSSGQDLGAMGLVLLCWIFGFGWVSRRFERQADVFGVRCLGWNRTQCGLSGCRVHHPAEGEAPDAKALCPAAAKVFAEALHRIAVLNGIAPKARSWRHSSIASRMDFVRALAADPKKLRTFNRTILVTKTVLVLGTAVGCGVGLYHYWPEEFFGYWRNQIALWWQ